MGARSHARPSRLSVRGSALCRAGDLMRPGGYPGVTPPQQPASIGNCERTAGCSPIAPS